MSDCIPKPLVMIEQADGEWVVKVFEDGAVRKESFVLEAFARSFAEGQRIRLGLAKIEKR
jgi:hypothetical protein